MAISTQCPRFISRDAWTPRRQAASIPTLAIRPTPLVIIHPTQVITCTNQRDCSQSARLIQTHHMDFNGWADISYHFLIAEDNRIYVGRGWSRQGENVGAFNNQAINVGYIGRFVHRQPTPEARAVLHSLIECGISEGHLTPDVRVAAQCQVTNIAPCNNTFIYEWISGRPRFIENPHPI